MAKHGEDKTQKRLSVAKARFFPRKSDTWTMRSIAGAYKKDESLPLAFIVRDMLRIADSMWEAKYEIQNNNVHVNGAPRKDYRFSVGLFDIVEIPKLNKRYRMVLDSKGRLALSEIDHKSKLEKLCKVKGKKVVKGKKFVLSTNDGLMIETKDSKIPVGAVLKISLPDHKVMEVLEQKKGNLVYVCGGTHASAIAKITDMTQGDMLKDKMVYLEGDEGKFLTTEKYIFVLGTGKPAIELGKAAESE
jgi:small subunit ribosomal protein S4e